MYSGTFLCQINITRDCNLRCQHCYISTDKKAQSQFMTIEQYKQVIDQLCDFAKKRKKYKNLEIHVIGGEPTMLPYKFHQEAVSYSKEKFAKLDINVRLGLVTNMVTSKAIKVSHLYDNVATSYEVQTRFINKQHKPVPELESKWVENCVEFINSGKELSITTAITRQAIDMGAANLAEYLYKSGFRHMHFGFFIPSGDGAANIGSVFPEFEETSKFLIEMTDWYLKKREVDDSVSINPVESLINSLYKNEPNDDIVCPIIPGSIDIDWDGETVTCIEAGGEVDFESLGNVYETTIDEIMSSKKYRQERQKAIRIKPHCQGCDKYKVCQMACGILHDYWDGEGECPGFKGFIDYVEKKVVEDNVKPKYT